jgi:hypothetical protein
MPRPHALNHFGEGFSLRFFHTPQLRQRALVDVIQDAVVDEVAQILGRNGVDFDRLPLE